MYTIDLNLKNIPIEKNEIAKDLEMEEIEKVFYLYSFNNLFSITKGIKEKNFMKILSIINLKFGKITKKMTMISN